MITGILIFLKKIPYQLWLLIGALLSFWLYGRWQFEQGQQDVQERWNISIEEGKKLLKELEGKIGKVNTVIETKYVDRIKVVHEKAKTIIKEIPVYIPVDSPDLPSGFRVLHDAAAASEVPDRSRITTAATVPVATATETIVTNYETCHQWREQVLGWQEWYREQSLVWQTAQYK